LQFRPDLVGRSIARRDRNLAGNGRGGSSVDKAIAVNGVLDLNGRIGRNHQETEEENKG